MNIKSNDEDFDFERFQKQVKQNLFIATKNYLKYCGSFSPFVFYFLILVQSLQILWFSIHPELKFLGQPLALEYVRVGISYLQFQQLIRSNNDLLQPLLIFTSFAIAAHVFTLVLSIKLAFNSKKHKKLLKIIYKIASVQIILLNTIFTIPFFNVCIMTLYCQPNGVYYVNRTIKAECYDITHIVLCLLAASSLLCILMESFFFWFIFYTRNPFSQCYYAMAGNLCRLARVAIKLLPPIYFLIDPTQQFQRIYIFFILAMAAAYLVMIRYFGEANFCSKNYHVELFMENILLWFTINNIINFYLDTQDKSHSFAFIEAFMCSILFASAIHSYNYWITQKFFIAGLKGEINKNQMVSFMYLLIDMYVNNSRISKIDKFVCLEQLNQSLKDKSIDMKEFLAKRNTQSQKSQQFMSQFLLLLVDVFAEDNKALELKFIRINFLSMSGSKVTALHEVSDISRDKLSVSNDFTIFLFREQNCHSKASKSGFQDSQQSALKIERYLQFSALLNLFEDKAEECAKISQQFWEQLQEDVPSMSKIYNLAEKSVCQKGKIKGIFRQIEQIFPENYTSLFLYYKFLSQVNISAKEKQRIKARLTTQKHKVDIMDDHQIRPRKVKFMANQNLLVISVSTTQMNFGNVLNVNSEIKRMMGYDKSEVRGQKITKLMPNIYQDIHDDFIKDYLKLTDSVRNPSQKYVYVLKKNVTIAEAVLEIKICPSPSNDFQLVGFVKEDKSQEGMAEIMVNLNNLEIIGFTHAFLNLTGDKICMEEVAKQPMKISHVFPELVIPSDLSCMQELETIFRFSDCTEKLIDLERSEMSKWGSEKVTIIVKYLSHYRTCDVAIFTVLKKDNDLHSIKRAQTNSNMFKKLSSNEMIKIVASQNVEPSSTTCYVDDDEEDVQIQKQINDFILKNGLQKQQVLMKVFFIILCLILLVSMIGIEIYFSNSTQNIPNLLEQIRLADQVSEEIGFTAHITLRLFDAANNATEWNQYKDRYRVYLQSLQIDTLSLYQKVNRRRGEKLFLNEDRHYNFSEQFDDGNSAVVKQSTNSYHSALFRYIFTGKQLLNTQIEAFSEPLGQRIGAMKIFMAENSKKNFPYLSRRTSVALCQLSTQILNNIGRMILIGKISKNLLVLIVFAVIMIALQKISSFLYLTFQVYNQIDKSDAKIFENFCIQFYSESLANQDSDRIRQAEEIESIQISTKSILTVLIEVFTLNLNTYKLDSQLAQEERHNLVQLQPNENRQSFSNQKINLQENNNLKYKYLIGFISMLFLVMSEVVFIPMEIQLNSAAFGEKKDLTRIGQFAKNTVYSMHFGYQSLKAKLGQQSSPYQELFRSQIKEFYQTSSRIHNLILQQSIKNIYKEIQAMVYLVEEAPADRYTQSEFITQFNVIETNLLRQTENVSLSRQRQLNESSQQIVFEVMKKAVIKGIVQSLLTLVFFKIVYEQIINFISCKAHRSACMMRLLPITLINASLNFLSQKLDQRQFDRKS